MFVYSVENTWKEIQDSSVDTAILPFGAVEQHGHHLPLGTDWLIAEATSKLLGEQLDAYVLPAMPFGCSREHLAFPGTITLRPSTLAAVLEDLVESLRHHGVRNLVVVSSHGGNWILKPTLRELNFRYPELNLIWAGGPIPDEGDPVPEDIHAGRGETSTMLHLRPDLVKEDLRDLDSAGVVGQEFNDYVGFEKTTKTGAWGVPREASSVLGKERVAETVNRQADYVRWALKRLMKLKQAPSVVDEGQPERRTGRGGEIG